MTVGKHNRADHFHPTSSCDAFGASTLTSTMSDVKLDSTVFFKRANKIFDALEVGSDGIVCAVL